MKKKPDISAGSKKVFEAKKYVPIYSTERLQQIDTAKKIKVEKLRQEMELKKKLAEEEDIAKSVPTYKGADMNAELCFDPENVKSMVYDDLGKKRNKARETSEDEEVKNCCSFRPNTNKRSEQLFSKVRF